jgi:peptidoglycan/LPS O-acetylase OafA/YrhL
MKYRAEIDGLRALAVLPVILFHAGFELFSGGFVGVDVFFVISGYLITTILIEDIENKRFSILNFYERRARRILPALFLVMLVFIPFAWNWMIPSQMKDFSQSLLAVSLFASNILFWRESGYFDLIAEEKPLLHTWSLAVEEQYYVLFPIFLILTWRFGKNRVFWMIVVMAAISLLLSEWGWRNYPTANFYLAPTRAWEIFAGSIAAFIVHKQGVRSNGPLSLLGLVAIVFSIFAYDENTPFPSVYALVPVLGVVLLILYGQKKTFAANLLSTKTFVGVGLISYSAYLWHQPLFAFARIENASNPSNLLMSVLVVVSLALAYFSWRYVEAPFRSKEKIGKNKVFFISICGLIAFSAFGLIGHQKNGFSGRESMAVFSDLIYDNSSFGYTACNNELDRENPELNYCYKASKKVSHILIGDSHADDKFHGLVQNSPHIEWMMLGNSSCPPLMDVNIQSLDGTVCTERLEKIFKFIHKAKGIETVILSFAHIYPLDEMYAADHIRNGFKASDMVLQDRLGHAVTPIDVFEAGLRRTTNYLRSKGIAVVLLIDIPELKFMPKDCLRNKVSCEFNHIDVTTRQKVHRDLLSKISRDTEGVRVFDSLSVFCANNEDRCSVLKDGRTLYRDSHHLSHFGSIEFGKVFASFFIDETN